jgi:hypothetical protein
MLCWPGGDQGVAEATVTETGRAAAPAFPAARAGAIRHEAAIRRSEVIKQLLSQLLSMVTSCNSSLQAIMGLRPGIYSK